jgi:hypothetical protein
MEVLGEGHFSMSKELESTKLFYDMPRAEAEGLLREGGREIWQESDWDLLLDMLRTGFDMAPKDWGKTKH